MMKLKLMMLLSVLMLLVGLNTTDSIAQVSELKLQTRQNGFSGVFTTEENKKLLVEYQSSTSDSFISRIQTSDGQTLAEAVRDKDVITVTVKDVSLNFYLDKEKRKQRPETSEEDKQKLKKYKLSKEFAPVRKLIAELIRQYAGSEKEQLKGFVIMSMVLGDGPGAPDASQAKANCSSPKLVQMYASYRQQSQPKITNKLIAGKSVSSNLDQCFGCCGAACWGCTGCWTGACAAHDECVRRHDDYFASECMALLDDAIASMILECALSQ